MKRTIPVVAGILIWLGAIGITWYLSVNRSDERVTDLATDLYDHVTGSRQTVVLFMDESVTLGVGDPVFIVDSDGEYVQVGEISAIPARVPLRHGTVGDVTTGEVLLYPNAPQLSEATHITAHETPETMEWVIQTMLPPQKRDEIAREIRDAFESHHQEIIAALRPVIEDGFHDALEVVEQDLEAAILARSDRLERIGSKYQADLVEDEIVPLVRTEIFPIVRRHGEPLATDVGKEMWDEASLWRFGWRYAYDLSPLPQRDLARKEWNRFLNDDAIPILERHIDDFIEMQQQVFRDVARNPRVQSVVRNSLREIVRDPEVQAVVMDIIREVFIDNPRLRDALRRHWNSPRARNAFQLASQRFEPTAVQIGEMLFGSEETGITPEFARVLRNQVLKKDRRWLVLHPGQVDDLGVPHQLRIKVEPGDTRDENPFVFAMGRLP